DGENATVLGPSHGLVVNAQTLRGISVDLCLNGNRLWCPELRFADGGPVVPESSIRCGFALWARISASSRTMLALVQTNSEPSPIRPASTPASKGSSLRRARRCAATAMTAQGHSRPSRLKPDNGPCPLCPESGQIADRLDMSACQERTHAPQQKISLFD